MKKVVLRIIDDQVLIGDLHKKVLDQLGVTEKCRPYFAIMEGKSRPSRKLKQTDKVKMSSNSKGLFLHKWCFDQDHEDKLLEDEAACNLIYNQAVFGLKTGRIVASIEEKMALNELSCSARPSKPAFIQLCRRLPGYFIVNVDNCLLNENSTLFPNTMNCVCKVSLSKNDLAITTENHIATICWKHIKQWSLQPSEPSLTYIITCFTDSMNNTTCDERILCLESEQLEYLLAATHEFIKNLQNLSHQNAFFGSMIRTEADGRVIWSNPLNT